MAVDDEGPTPQGSLVPRSSIQVIDRTVALLRAIAGAGGGGLSLKDVTTAVGLRPSTGRTLLSALATHGLVRQAGPGRSYMLGPTFFELNRSYVAQSDLASVAAPVLRELWRTTNETVHLSVLKDSLRVDLSVLVSPQLLNINPTTATFEDESSTPPFRTAAGKVLFAALPTEQRDAMLKSAPWRTTGKPTRAALEKLVGEVLAQGYATNYEEDAPGVCGVAAPVRDHTGRTVAALCIGYPSVRHSAGHDETLRRAVARASEELSVLLGAPTSQTPEDS
ncbi:IclR family transcriptional regulator [Occultella gossypii]|uniref:IclR family transcriptional regulator n=1 Tax=Occultella gossypii TaxID=2800820 RepID=A0ABS7SK84_9MICO|nr:IclR family transcriptional regulator [Occultella gossypii]MBZ2199688.1 IclR family transcriptional regulator [Occultella gossypii]